MSGAKFTDELKRDAVAQVEDRGCPVREVAERLGVSTKSIYTWQKLFSRPAKVIKEVAAQADEIRRLKRDLARVTEERDILKKAIAYVARESRASIGSKFDVRQVVERSFQRIAPAERDFAEIGV